jgi:tetratricopeptide (TPR) repeat protein
MWIERMVIRLPILARVTGLLLVLVSLQAGAQQYRSKILITPEGEISKGAELSIDELEQQIGSIESPYAKSSAGRHLARHYVQQKEYDKAIEFYRTALAAEGLSAVANREMLRELAQVYLLKEDYSGAVQTLESALRLDLVPEVNDYLLLAQAHYRLGKYVAVVVALDQIKANGLTMNTVQMRQALALYYRAGAYAQCEQLLLQLIELEPNNPENWHQLASVYLQQDKKRQALDQLTLAREKAVPFSEADILLLADLQAVNQNPYGAAEILQQALAQQEIEANGRHYRKLFEFWFLSREQEKATAALKDAARLTGDIELYLYLAQLQMDNREWRAMYQTMVDACAKELPDKYVGRANLLLGISQLKLGDEVAARRSFINATLIVGVNVKADQWLNFMNAEPATKAESRRIVSICYGSVDKKVRPGGIGAAADTVQTAEQDIQVKTVLAMRLFYSEHDIPLAELAQKVRSLMTRMGVSLVKSGGSIDGPVQIISGAQGAAEGELQLALPARGAPRAGGRYRVRSTSAFKAAYLVQTGSGEELVRAWLRFAEAVQVAGYELTGERRLVMSQGGSVDKPAIELQLGIE